MESLSAYNHHLFSMEIFSLFLVFLFFSTYIFCHSLFDSLKYGRGIKTIDIRDGNKYNIATSVVQISFFARVLHR